MPKPTKEAMKQPKLRFPEFERDWEVKKLGEFTSWSSGGTPSKKEAKYWNGDIPWISASSMRGMEYYTSNAKITEEGLRNGTKLAPKGVLLLLVRGSILFKKIPIGITKREVAFNQDVKAIKILGISFSKYLLYWFLASETVILNMVTGTGIGAGKLDLADLKALKVKLPSLPEQQKIASFLSAIDYKRQTLAKQKTLWTQYKKGIMQQIFSQQIRFKQENGEDFADWEEKRLGEVVEIKSPKYNPKKETAIFKCIELEHIVAGENRLSGYFEKASYKSVKNKFQKGDILFGKLRPYLKKNIQAPFDGICSSEIWVLKGTKISNDFVFIITQTKQFMDLANQSTGSKMPRADWNVVKNGMFFIPSLPEQTLIASFLTSIDQKIQLLDQQIKLMDQYKRGLLQQLFC